MEIRKPQLNIQEITAENKLDTTQKPETNNLGFAQNDSIEVATYPADKEAFGWKPVVERPVTHFENSKDIPDNNLELIHGIPGINDLQAQAMANIMKASGSPPELIAKMLMDKYDYSDAQVADVLKGLGYDSEEIDHAVQVAHTLRDDAHNYDPGNSTVEKLPEKKVL